MKQSEELRTRVMRGDITNDYLTDMGDVNSTQLILSGFELYRSTLQQVERSKNFQDIPRRSILLPTSFLWHSRSMVQIAGAPHFPLFNNTRHNINLDMTVLKFSHKDVLLVKRAIAFQ